jgi:2-hydroxychromene-2-carboxylate isomerase
MIEFFFDFASPYSYVAAHRIELLATQYGRTVDWRPFLMAAVFKASGSVPLVQQYAPKARYALIDFARSAELAGLDFRLPDPFPIMTQNAARAALWVKGEAPARIGDFVRAVTRAYFVDNAAINEPAVLAGIGTTLGFDGDALVAATTDASIKDALRRDTDEAIARGVFGTPFVFVDGEPFWGNDRLDHVQARLAAHSEKA